MMPTDLQSSIAELLVVVVGNAGFIVGASVPARSNNCLDLFLAA
jgi:hypothetical protein